MFEAGEGATRIDVRSVWFLMLYASNLLDRLTTAEREKLLHGEHDNDLFDVLASALAAQMEERMKAMLRVGYRTRAEPLARVRGRIDHLGTARRRLMESGRVLCRFAEQTVDLPRYRFVLVTLRLAAQRAESRAVRLQCQSVVRALAAQGVRQTDPTPSELSTEQYGHFDAADRGLVEVAKLVRDMCAPEHTPGTVSLPRVARDERALRDLFEQAVRGFYRHHLGRQGFRAEKRRETWAASGSDSDLAFLPTLNADVVMLGPEKQLIVECKFAPIFTMIKGTPRLKPDFVRQVHAYGVAFAERTELPTELVLLGALVRSSQGRDLDLTLGGFPLRVREVDLSLSPSEIRRALLAAAA